MTLYKFTLIIVFMILSGCLNFSDEKEKNHISNVVHKIKNNEIKFLSKILLNNITSENKSNGISINKNFLFFLNQKGILKAIDLKNKNEIWKIKIPNHENKNFNATIKIFNKKIILINSGFIYAIDCSNGNIIWKKYIPEEILSDPVISYKHQLIFIRTNNGPLYALNEINGIVKWTINLNVPLLSIRGNSTPQVESDYIIIGGDDGIINAISLNRKQIIWKQRISNLTDKQIYRINDIDSNPIISNGIIYAIAYNGNFAALDLYSGQIIWKRKFGSKNNIILDKNKIYFISQNNKIFSMNTEYGNVLWNQNDFFLNALTEIFLYKKYLILGDYNKGYIYLLNKNNGRLLAKKQIDASGLKQLIIDNEKIFFYAKNSKLYSVEI